jgi:hypothetical protein
MSEATSLLFVAITIFAISLMFRRVFRTSDSTRPPDQNISDMDLSDDQVPLNILYSESQAMQKPAPKQTPSVLDLAPWQLEVAVEISRLVKTEAKQERYTAPLIEEIPLPVDVVSRAVESEVYLQR